MGSCSSTALRSRSLASAARNLDRDRGRQATQTDEMHLDPLENEVSSTSRWRPKYCRAACVFTMLLGLHHMCNHPVLVPRKQWADDEVQLQPLLPELATRLQNSGKTARLLEIPDEMLEPRRWKVLIFTCNLDELHLLAKFVAA